MKIVHIIGSTGSGKTESLKSIVGKENIFHLETVKNKLPSQTCIGIDDVRYSDIPNETIEFLKYTGVDNLYIASESLSNNAYYKHRFEKIVNDKMNPSVCIFNIDGVLSNLNGRDEFDTRNILMDHPYYDMIFMLKSMRKVGLKIIFVSSRPEIIRDETISWLQVYEMFEIGDQLFMRMESDKGADILAQNKIIIEIAKTFHIHFVFSSRGDLVNMYRQSGLRCFQVSDYN